jgi:hypothetical protein
MTNKKKNTFKKDGDERAQAPSFPESDILGVRDFGKPMVCHIGKEWSGTASC